MVRLLLSRGANINAFDKRDRRAIHWAAYMGNKTATGIFTSYYYFSKQLYEFLSFCAQEKSP